MQADASHPLIDQPGKLSSAEMLRTVVPARKNVVVGRTIMVLEPSQDADASRLKQFELDGPACLLLHDGRSCSHPDTADEIADPDFDDVTEADCPHLLRLQPFLLAARIGRQAVRYMRSERGIMPVCSRRKAADDSHVSRPRIPMKPVGGVGGK